MSDVDGRLRELEARLRDDPDDSATWLVYGDLLQQRDDPRGTLIQLEQRSASRSQIAALVERHARTWRGAIPAAVEIVAWQHGFPSALATPWNEEAPALVARTLALPEAQFVRALRLTAVEPRDDEEHEDEYDEEAFATGEPRPIDAGALAELSLAHIRTLDLSYLRIGPEGAMALARADLAGLTTLDLRYGAIRDAGLRALAPRLREIERLRLQRNGIEAEGIAALASATLPRLVELDLRYNPIGEAGARALANAPFLASLARLDLYRADATPGGARVLAEAPLPIQLRTYWRGL